MGYPLLILMLGILGGCAIAAYELIDAIERDQDAAPTGASQHARAVVVWGAISDADRLDGRIRGVEEQLDRLEGVCLRLEHASGR